MKSYYKIIALSAVVLFFSCSSSDDTSSGNGGGGIIANASYRVTFVPNFNEVIFPTDYPINARFSKVFW